jgi:hypothetical protein
MWRLSCQLRVLLLGFGKNFSSILAWRSRIEPKRIGCMKGWGKAGRDPVIAF